MVFRLRWEEALRGYGERGSCSESYGMIPISLEILTHEYLLILVNSLIYLLDIMIQAGINAILKSFSIYVENMKVKTIEMLRKKSHKKVNSEQIEHS